MQKACISIKSYCCPKQLKEKQKQFIIQKPTTYHNISSYFKSTKARAEMHLQVQLRYMKPDISVEDKRCKLKI